MGDCLGKHFSYENKPKRKAPTVSIHTYTSGGLTLDELLPDRRKDLQAQTADRLYAVYGGGKYFCDLPAGQPVGFQMHHLFEPQVYMEEYLKLGLTPSALDYGFFADRYPATYLTEVYTEYL